MSGIAWDGSNAKAHSRAEAEAIIDHNDLEERYLHEHSNEHLDVTLTDRNYALGEFAGMSSDEKKKRLNDTLDCYGYKDVNGKNKRVAARAVTIWPPDGMLTDENTEAVTDKDGDEHTIWTDTPELHAWFESALKTFSEKFGAECVISADVHFDEQHDYLGGTSRPHLQIVCVPLVFNAKTGGLKICSKEFTAGKSNRKGAHANIDDFNKRIEKMTREQYGMDYFSDEPSPKREHESAEQLKAKETIKKAEIEAGAIVDVAQMQAQEITSAAQDAVNEKYAEVESAQQAIDLLTAKQTELMAELSETAEAIEDAEERREKAEQAAAKAEQEYHAGYEEGKAAGEAEASQLLYDAQQRDHQSRETARKVSEGYSQLLGDTDYAANGKDQLDQMRAMLDGHGLPSPWLRKYDEYAEQIRNGEHYAKREKQERKARAERLAQDVNASYDTGKGLGE